MQHLHTNLRRRARSAFAAMGREFRLSRRLSLFCQRSQSLSRRGLGCSSAATDVASPCSTKAAWLCLRDGLLLRGAVREETWGPARPSDSRKRRWGGRPSLLPSSDPYSTQPTTHTPNPSFLDSSTTPPCQLPATSPPSLHLSLGSWVFERLELPFPSRAGSRSPIPRLSEGRASPSNHHVCNRASLLGSFEA